MEYQTFVGLRHRDGSITEQEVSERNPHDPAYEAKDVVVFRFYNRYYLVTPQGARCWIMGTYEYSPSYIVGWGYHQSQLDEVRIDPATLSSVLRTMAAEKTDVAIYVVAAEIFAVVVSSVVLVQPQAGPRPEVLRVGLYAEIDTTEDG